MNGPQRVAVYDSRSQEYHRAFEVFLAHTDQKTNARAWLDRLVGGLERRGVFIDAGAGNGAVTAWYTGAFQGTIAIEPNASLRGELSANCPSAAVLAEPILQAAPVAAGDLVLCSHVFYYLPAAEWLPTLERLVSWLSPEGTLVVALQNHETDCMDLLERFHGVRFDLARLAEQFAASHQDDYDIRRETVAAHVTTNELASALTIAEFMLNLIPASSPPPRSDLETWVRTRFQQPDGRFRFSCHQDFLQVRRRI